jgi:hypothetical protein
MQRLKIPLNHYHSAHHIFNWSLEPSSKYDELIIDYEIVRFDQILDEMALERFIKEMALQLVTRYNRKGYTRKQSDSV